MRHFRLMVVLGSLVFAISCSSSLDQSPTDPVEKSGWTIPRNEVRDGGPGKDGIPALENPSFEDMTKINYMEDNDLIIGVKYGDVIKGYTHPVLDWHEIINDQEGTDKLTVTYCPLTGTAIGWNRVIDGKETTFGVSGLLYNSNLMPYDRESDSYWSQIIQESVNGKLKSRKAEQVSLIETSWKTWKKMFPDSKVVTTDTGHDRNYGTYPYGGYKSNDNLIFSVSRKDDVKRPKERVLGLLTGNGVHIYSFDDLSNGVITENYEGTEYVIFGSIEENYLVIYKNNLKGQKRTFVENASDDGVATDDKGNTYDLFGEVLDGPDKGWKLGKTDSYIGYWFSFPPFYDADEISFYTK